MRISLNRGTRVNQTLLRKKQLFIAINWCNWYKSSGKHSTCRICLLLQPDFNKRAAAFNPVLYEAKKVLLHFDVVSAKGSVALADGVHMDAASQRTFGKRYAKKMKAVKVD